MSTGVTVRAPCRLHFGMFGFGHADRTQFGGVGAMIEPPEVRVKITPANRFDVRGSLADRGRQYVGRLASLWRLSNLPDCEITIRSPRSHTGLGVGTQLALAIAQGLRRFLNLAELPIDELAAVTGRGGRSAVGTHGFQHGGLIVDAGKEPSESLGKLAVRVPLPDSWRFVLLCQRNIQGLAGPNETEAFSQLPPVADEVTRELWEITTGRMLPAIERADCGAFGEAVYRYGGLAGECFSPRQGGPFANADIARWVKSIREFGVPGVGQSSWGPSIFAVTANDEESERLIHWIRGRVSDDEYEITVARPNNSGATISVVEAAVTGRA